MDVAWRVLSGCCLEGVEWMLLDVVLSGCCLMWY